MSSDVCFVLVHIGEDDFPLHMYQCISQIRKFNPHNKLFIILNKKNRRYSKLLLKSYYCKVEYLEDFKTTDRHKIFRKKNKLKNKGLGNFWEYTTERFFYIEELIIKYELENVVHMENDVLLYTSMNSLVSIMMENYQHLAVTQDNDKRAIGGIVYMHNKESIADFTSFIVSTEMQFNDMELLATYLNERRAKGDYNLPVVPNNYIFHDELVNKNGDRPKRKEIYYNNYIKFNAIFDAAAIGQYLGGIDKIHSLEDTRGFINETAYYDPSKFDYIWSENETGRVPYAKYHGEMIPIINLHIHSKQLADFMSRKWTFFSLPNMVIIKSKIIRKIYRYVNYIVSKLYELRIRIVRHFAFRPGSYPYISGDSFRRIAEFCFDELEDFDPRRIKLNDIVFVKGDYIDKFFLNVHPLIEIPYILITHNSDQNINISYKKRIDDKITHWYAQNLMFEDEKVTALPIGLENKHYFKNGNTREFTKVRRSFAKDKFCRILMSFNIDTNKAVRQTIYDILKDNPLVDIKWFETPMKYKMELQKYMFVISPPGNGIDCHRTWEAAYLKVVPVIQKSILSCQEKLPILSVDSWEKINEMNENDLREAYTKIYNENIKYDNIWMKYWIGKIQENKKNHK